MSDPKHAYSQDPLVERSAQAYARRHRAFLQFLSGWIGAARTSGMEAAECKSIADTIDRALAIETQQVSKP